MHFKIRNEPLLFVLTDECLFTKMKCHINYIVHRNPKYCEQSTLKNEFGKSTTNRLLRSKW